MLVHRFRTFAHPSSLRPERAAAFAREVARYLIAGGFNTALGFMIYVTGLKAGVPYLFASVLAWLISLVVAFTLQSSLVFRLPLSRDRFLRFIALSLSSLAVSTTLLFVLVSLVGLDPVLASLATTSIVILLNYLSGKFLVFTKGER